MKSAAAIPPAIFARLTAAIGIDPRALDPARFHWIVKARCRHLHLPDDAAYAAHLEATPSEIDALIDLVVVQETRFFRDPAVFAHIRAAIPQLAAAFAAPLRILSAPCGTGQEAWSLAALCALAGIPHFEIDAVDISLSALQIARLGLYPEHALRHVTPDLRQAAGTIRYKLFEVHPALRDRVHFERRNLAEPAALAPEPRYHLILCRNLFIYLRPEARTALAHSLAQALLPGGRLVLGTADRVEELTPLFAPLRPAASFAFLHRAVARTPAKTVATPHSRKPNPKPALIPTPTTRHLSAPDPAAPNPAAPNPALDLLQRALDHQRHGDIARAERVCRQALYLAPTFLPALELLQSLWSQNPNLRLRRALRDRILRTRTAPTPASPSQPTSTPAAREETA